METNEAVKTTLIQQTEAAIIALLSRVEAVQEGDLKGVEQEVLRSVFALGRTILEQLIQSQRETETVPTRRRGTCGHAQRLVGIRPKQVLTLLGPITIKR